MEKTVLQLHAVKSRREAAPVVIDTLGCPECASDRSHCARALAETALIKALPVSSTAASLTANRSVLSRRGRRVDSLEDRRQDLPIAIGAARAAG